MIQYLEPRCPATSREFCHNLVHQVCCLFCFTKLHTSYRKIFPNIPHCNQQKSFIVSIQLRKTRQQASNVHSDSLSLELCLDNSTLQRGYTCSGRLKWEPRICIHTKLYQKHQLWVSIHPSIRTSPRYLRTSSGRWWVWAASKASRISSAIFQFTIN